MSFQFDLATTHRSLGEGRYDTPIEDGWDINGNANGGYLLAIAANAMRAHCERAHPISISMHYLSPAPAGGAETHTEVVKAGRRLATVVGAITRDGKDIARSIGTFGDIDSSQGPQFIDLDELQLPAYDDCPTRAFSGAAPIGLGSRLAMRLHPDDVGFATGNPPGRAEVRGYFAFADDRPVDTLSLLLAADAFPPVMFNLYGMLGWVPTVEFTVHMRGVPAPGPIACRFRSHVVQGGFWEEDGEMWDSQGQLVAMSRQLALVPLAQS